MAARGIILKSLEEKSGGISNLREIRAHTDRLEYSEESYRLEETFCDSDSSERSPAYPAVKKSVGVKLAILVESDP